MGLNQWTDSTKKIERTTQEMDKEHLTTEHQVRVETAYQLSRIAEALEFIAKLLRDEAIVVRVGNDPTR